MNDTTTAQEMIGSVILIYGGLAAAYVAIVGAILWLCGWPSVRRSED